MATTSSRSGTGRSWLSLGSASRLLGVSPTTLRRWCDAGRVKAYTTPGGHRRFSRAALEAMLPAERGRRPTLERLGETPDRVARVLRDRARRARGHARWLPSIAGARRDAFRERGRGLAAALMAYLDASSAQERHERLEHCAAAARDYGRLAATAGLSLSDAVEGFLRFRGPFIAEMAALSRRRGLDTSEATELLQASEEAMDRLLLETLRGHEAVTPAIRVSHGRSAAPSREEPGSA